MVSRPGLGRAISETLCSDCAFSCGQPQAEACGPRRNPPLRLGGRLPERICPVGPLSNRRDGCGFGVRPGQHCHSTLIVLIWHARRRVAVYGAPPSTLTTEWQCESHCHSTLNVPDALPLDPDRTDTVRSMPSGSEGGTATRPRTCRPVRSPTSGSVRHAAQRAHHRVAV